MQSKIVGSPKPAQPTALDYKECMTLQTFDSFYQAVEPGQPQNGT
jgi:hypothetical protein